MSRTFEKIVAIAVLAIFLAAAGLLGYIDWWRGSDDPGENEQTAVVVAGDWPGVEMPLLYQEPGRVENKPFNILVLGKGRTRNGQGKTFVYESITVIHVDESLEKIALLSIPRDTYVEIAGKGKQTLDEVYWLGDTALMKQVVEGLTGLRMRNTLVLSQEQFANLVDMSGGVEFTLQAAVSDPRWGSLETGTKRLGGKDALLVTVAPGYPGGEPARIQSRNAFFIAAANQLHRAGQQPGQAWVINLGMEGLETDLAAETVIRLAREFISWPVVNISAGIAPGSSGTIDGKSVYLLDQEAMKQAAKSIEANATVPSR